MKIIIHIGPPKTGTTSLQNFFGANRDTLLRSGVLYPALPLGYHHNVPLVFRYKAPPRWYVQGVERSAEDYLQIGLDNLSLVAEQIEREQPHTVILSSEFFFVKPDPEDLGRFKTILNKYTEDIQVVCYVPDPVMHYVSYMLQVFRGTHIAARPFVSDFPSILDAYSQVFTVNAHSFNKSDLIGGDIVNDFLGRYLPDDLPTLDVSGNHNISPTVEVLSILADYRRHLLSDKQNIFTPDSSHLLKCLQNAQIKSGVPANKQLQPWAIELIRQKSQDNVRYFSERFQIDLMLPEPNEKALKGVNTSHRLKRSPDEIFSVDQNVKQIILAHTLHSFVCA